MDSTDNFNHIGFEHLRETGIDNNEENCYFGFIVNGSYYLLQMVSQLERHQVQK